MVLRIVAGDSPSRSRLAIVRLAAGSAVWTYVSMTAPRTCRSRSVRGVGISAKLFHANNLRSSGMGGQVTHQSVETQPPLRSASDPITPHFQPPRPIGVGLSDGRIVGLRNTF